jgi:hypothetical protein
VTVFPITINHPNTRTYIKVEAEVEVEAEVKPYKTYKNIKN